MIDIDNTQPEDYHHDQEPDRSSYANISKEEYNAYMANPDNFSDEESTDETPEQMNNWLRKGGW